jgi:hypothetical protein
MRWNRFILIFLCATIALGGTFTCKSDDDSVKFTSNPRTATTR